jgi:hypothetical protein
VREHGGSGPGSSSRRATGGLRRSVRSGVAQAVRVGPRSFFDPIAGEFHRLVPACFACRVLDAVIIPDVILRFDRGQPSLARGFGLGSIADGTPDASTALAERMSRWLARKRGNSRPLDRHRPFTGHKHSSGTEGGNSRRTAQPCALTAEDVPLEKFEGQARGQPRVDVGGPDRRKTARLKRAQRVEPRGATPGEPLTPNALEGGNSQRLVHTRLCSIGSR